MTIQLHSHKFVHNPGSTKDERTSGTKYQKDAHKMQLEISQLTGSTLNRRTTGGPSALLDKLDLLR